MEIKCNGVSVAYMDRDRASSGHRLGVELSEGPSKPFRSKKKEKGYKNVGLGSSDEDDDIAILPPSEQSAAKSSSSSSKSRPFRLKKRKSFKERNTASEEALQRSKIKHNAGQNTNPFEDRLAARIQVQTVTAPPDFSEVYETQIFGIPLSRAIQIDRSPDGMDVPAFFRVCINYIEDHGLDTVGIYRACGVHSKIQELKHHFNRGDRVRLNDYDVATVADIIKLYIRELPSKILSDALTTELDECAELADLGRRVDAAIQVVNKMQSAERAVLGLILVHMTHVISRQDVNKMSLKNVALVLEPTLSIRSNKALDFLLTHATDLFPTIKLTQAKTDAKPLSSNEQNLALLREDLSGKESTLDTLHQQIKNGKASKRKEEKIWDIQRQVTELKRKIRTLEKITNVTSGGGGGESNQRRDSNASRIGTTDQQPLSGKSINSRTTESAPEDLRTELVEMICKYQLLRANNQDLRSRIVSEHEQLNAVCEQLKDCPPPEEIKLDKSEMMTELQGLIEQYRSSKKLSGELGDAILSETSDCVTIDTKINARAMMELLLSS